MRACLLYILWLSCFAVFAQDDHFVTPQVNPGLHFTENAGQWEPFIKYRMQLDGGQLYMEKDGLTYNFYDKRKYRSFHMGGLGRTKDPSIRAHAIKVEFVGCNKDAVTESHDAGTFYENFYLGNDPSRWKSNVKNYQRVVYRDLYSGIDYEASTYVKAVKYNFYVKPGADPSQIKLKYNGADKIKIRKGELIIPTNIDSIIEKKPYAYQKINGEVVEVLCKYKLIDGVVSFELPSGYNKAYELIIDPFLVFAAQSGSTADNFGMTATYDAAGNLYSGGTVFNNGYPVTTGAYQITFAATYTPGVSNTDVVVTKYSATGSTLLFSTYLGGLESEIVTSLIVDASNNLYLYGATGSSNFPITPGAYDNTFNGGSYLYFYFNGTEFKFGTDIFVSKFNSTGTSLLASTFLGGSANDGVNHNNVTTTFSSSSYDVFCPVGVYSYTISGEYKADSLQYNYGDQYRGEIQLDKNGDVYIASSTRSSNFPIIGGFDNTLGGKQDAIIAKFNSSLSSVIWSSYLGGSKNDAGYSLIVTDSLYTYVTGGTYSTDFPVTPGCYQTTYNGGKADGYIVKINPAGSAILKSTYFGTNDYDQTYFIQKDRAGDIYVYGQSLGNMPVTTGVYSNPGSHQFITRFDRQLSNINMSTVFGSGAAKLDISPSAFAVDQCSGTISFSGWGGNIIFGPSTYSLPVSPGAVQPTSANGYDFYVGALNPNATALWYGTYFGGACSKEHVDGGTSRFSETGKLYQSVCAGCGGYDDFPVTPGSWPNTPGNPNHNTDNNNCNNGVFKIDLQPVVTAAFTTPANGCEPLTVNFNNVSSPGLVYQWSFGAGPTATSSAVNPSFTYTSAGTYTVKLVVIETQYCNSKDSITKVITVYPKINSNFTYTVVPCSDTVKFTNLSTTTATSQTATWNFGDATTSTTLNPIHTYSTAGTYTVLLTSSNGNCSDTAQQVITISLTFPAVASGPTLCNGDSGQLNASGGTSYSWTPSTGLSSTTASNPTASPTVTTVYSVAVTNSLNGCSRTLTTQVLVNPKPTANYGFSVNPCGGGVTFTDQSTSNITQWNWNFGNSQTSSAQNPYQFYSTGGTYTVSLIVANANGCYDTIIQPVTVGTPPPVSVSSTQTICIGGQVMLNASGGFAYQWIPATGLNISNIATPIASPSVTTQYSVVITNTNSIGDTCKFMLTTNVVVTQLSAIPISAEAIPDTVLLGSSTTLTLTATPGAAVTWYPAGSTQPAGGYSVTSTPEHDMTYTVVIQRGPCSDTLIVRVWVIEDGCFDTDVFIPNTFTPNGDGYNDKMYARGHKLAEVYFAIYNRWGEKVFETKDINEGWDGNHKGRPADVGVFGYYVKIKCVNGKETFKKGNITLIR
jgi:gliding motility-associated-like protein